MITTPWADEVDRLRRHLAELDKLIFGRGQLAEIRAARRRQKAEANEDLKAKDCNS